MKALQWDYSGLPDSIDPGKVKRLLAIALNDTRPTPRQSGYAVRGAGITQSGVIFSGSNHESGAQWSDHCEHTVVNSASELYGDEDHLEMLAIIAGEPGNVATPCGRCRDHLREYVPEGCYIISASPGGGEVTATLLGDYYSDDFKIMDSIIDNPKGFEEAFVAYGNSFNPFGEIPENADFGAAFLTANGIFTGSFYGTIGFDATLPISNAWTSIRDSKMSTTRFNVNRLVLASEKPIIPAYRDRQALRDMVDILKSTGTLKGSLPIVMLQSNGSEIIQAWETDSDEWLPHPFSASNLGLEEAIGEEFRRKFMR